MIVIAALEHSLQGDWCASHAILDELAHADLPPTVLLVDEQAAALTSVLRVQANYPIILIDITDQGYAAGTWITFTPETLPPDEIDHLSNELAIALRLAAEGGHLPDEITVYQLQPEPLNFTTGLSPNVRVAVKHIAGEIWQQILEVSEQPGSEMPG